MGQADAKRFQVFVSSTYLDLRVERQAVTSALLESDAFPAGMELFPATDDDAWSLIKRVIDESDYYILIIGGKYGSVDRVTGLSYTEMEYDYATKQGKPVMAFLHEDIGALPRDRTETDEKAAAALEAFTSKVRAAKHVKFWSTTEGLAGAVALSYNRFVKAYPAIGWIRADVQASSEVLQAFARAQERIAELEALVKQERTTPPPGSGDLAQGAATFSLPVFVNARYDQVGKSRKGIFAAWVRVEPDWDQVLGILGLKLFDEANTSELKELFESWIFQEFWVELDERMDEKLRDDSILRQDGTEYARQPLKVDDEDFGTILLQLKALGLIRGGSKKRSVSDSATYWALTPFGEQRLLEVRAVQKGEKELPVKRKGHVQVGVPGASD